MLTMNQQNQLSPLTSGKKSLKSNLKSKIARCRSRKQSRATGASTNDKICYTLSSSADDGMTSVYMLVADLTEWINSTRNEELKFISV